MAEPELSIIVLGSDGRGKAEAGPADEVTLFCPFAFQAGDRLVIHAQQYPVYAEICLDDAIGFERVYLTGDLVYTIPEADIHTCLSPRAFAGERHYLYARAENAWERSGYRCLSRNIYDQEYEPGRKCECYPHAFSNIETRSEAVFSARCAIDGLKIGNDHEKWPYTSWGLDICEKDPYWQLDFGRTVVLDRIRIWLRSDFPHDNWWKTLRICFEDGTCGQFSMEKTGKCQEFVVPKRTTSWIRMDQLMRDPECPSHFPALTQLEAYGWEKESE